MKFGQKALLGQDLIVSSDFVESLHAMRLVARPMAYIYYKHKLMKVMWHLTRHVVEVEPGTIDRIATRGDPIVASLASGMLRRLIFLLRRQMDQ